MVTAIGQHMARLDALMVDPARDATSKTAQAFEALQQRVSGILAQLFPEQAAFNQLKRDIDDLTEYAKKAGWSPQELDTAITKARADYYKALPAPAKTPFDDIRSEEHTSELQSLMRISYAVLCLKQKNNQTIQ